MTDATKQPDQPEKDDKITSEDYADLLDQYQFSTKEISFGKIIKGRVIKVTPTHVLVDIGFKSEGVIPIEEFGGTPAGISLKPGDEVQAMVERTDAKQGALILSKRRADAVRAVDALEKAYTQKTWITGRVRERTKNGFTVDVGIDAFLPASHADLRIVREPDKLIGQIYKFKVIKFDRKTENAVLSRKLFLQDEREKKRRRIFATLAKGQLLKGHVRSLTNFGAFVDIGGIEGLLHVSDLSWGKIDHPSEVVKVGQEIEVVVLDFNEKEEKISLGLKQLTPDPWSNVQDKYRSGQRLKGKVVSLTDFGAFVELEPGVEGLVHISDLSWSRKHIHPKKLLALGQEVEVSVLDVNADSKRISLGIKQLSPHPLELFKEKYAVGSRIKGVVTSLTDFGAFVEVEKGIEGLVHVSDISWEKVKHPADVLQVGQETEAIILAIDVDKQKVSLGIKQLQGDVWEEFFARQKPGDLVKVKVVRITDFGVFVEILPGIEGVVFLSELDEKKIDVPAEVFKVGDERTAKILKMSQKDKKISLSFRQAQADLHKQEYQRYLESQDNRMTLGDLMKDQLARLVSIPKKEAKPAAPEARDTQEAGDRKETPADGPTAPESPGGKEGNHD
jgi:small subunit ribosomal protein S1